MTRPYTFYMLIFCLVFLGLGGLYGGISMLVDPTGNLLQMAEVLPMLPVPDYTLPGLFLIIVMGLVPTLLAYALIVRPNWEWTQVLPRWSHYYWALTGTLALGITLAIWLFVQGLLIGFKWPIQYVTAADGVLIILLVLTPSLRRYFAK